MMNRWIAAVFIAVLSCGGDAPDSKPPGSGGTGGGAGDGGGSGGSSGSTADAGGPSDMTPEGICAYYADRYCEADHTCSYDFGFFWNDLSLCKERSQLSCLLRLTSLSVNEMSNRVVGCANALSNLSCERYPDYDRWPETCTFPPGQLPDGAACIVAEQCQGSACNIGSRVACGVCKTVSRIGGACNDENDCLDFMPCVNGICAPHPHAGEPCDGIVRSCVGTSVCRNLDANGIGTCGIPSPVGSACDPTQPDICDFTQGAYCDQLGKTCTKREPLGKIGEVCVGQSCPFVAFCDFDGFCRAKPREGQPCDLNGQCMTPARCIDGVCKIRDSAVCK